MKNDPFDLENLRLTPEFAATMGRAAAVKHEKARPKRSREQFVMVPLAWVERLKGAEGSAIFFVAIHILLQHWKTNGKPVPVSTRTLKSLGVSRWAKWRALRELEMRGLIRIKTRHKRSPLAVVL
jgi:hypothetical protein